MFRKTLFAIALISSTYSNIVAQRATCPPDTIEYAQAKTSAIDTLILDPLETSAAFQYYECPQEMKISGARFFGWKIDTVGGVTMPITVTLYRANVDSVPSQNILASGTGTLTIPDSLNGPLQSYAVDVTWNSVSIDDPYVVVVSADPTAPDFAILHNNIDTVASGDGDKEWLSGVRQGASWIKSYNYYPDSVQFDADFFIEPFVQYNINAGFTTDPECLFNELGDTVDFFNTGAPIVDSRMYNRNAFFNLNLRQRWNYGDGVIEEAINPSHFYPTDGPYVVVQKVRMLNWSGQVGSQLCESSATQIIKEKPFQDFSYTTNNLEVNFTNETFGLFSNIQYDFGDGNTSSSEDPKHKYFEPGTYWVCQTMQTSCGEVEKCKNVAVATNTALNCGKDSVRYAAARGTNTRMKALKPENPGRLFGLGQKFRAPQSIIVHGFSFYANHNGLFRDAYPVACYIYKDVNGFPDTLGPLAESEVYINKLEVDSNYSDTIRYTAIFNRPVNIKDDYILTIEYDSTTPISIAMNDWAANDGQNDFRAIGKVNDSTWVTPASVALFSCGGAACNADVLIEPLIEFNLNANFTFDFECMLNQQNVNLLDASSPILRDPQYNTISFNGSSADAFTWNFNDGTPLQNTVDAVHSFQNVGPYDVQLSVVYQGWTLNDDGDGACVASQVHNLPVPPTGGFSYEQIANEVTFIDSSINAEEWLWVFSDSTISTLRSPRHWFMSRRTFDVCQYVSNVCGSDTTCDSINVNVLGVPDAIADHYSIYPNPSKDFVFVETKSEAIGEINIDLIDLSGRMIRTYNHPVGTTRGTMYVGDLANGTYITKIRVNQYEYSRPLVVSH